MSFLHMLREPGNFVGLQVRTLLVLDSRALHASGRVNPDAAVIDGDIQVRLF